MKKHIILALLIGLLFLLTGCFTVDEEALEIARKGHYTDCDSLDTTDNKGRIEDCYATVGKKQDDPEACRAISIDNAYRRGECFEDVAVDTHNEDLCEEALNNKADCYGEIGAYKKNPNICMKLSGTDAHYCYKKYAEEAKDVAVCKSIPSDSVVRDYCFLSFMADAKDETFCNEFHQESYKDNCYLAIAPKVNGNLLCEKIVNGYKRDQCHIKMAVQMESIDECNRMKEVYTSSWNTCVNQVAVTTLDKNICQVMEKESDKEGCERQVLNAQVQQDAKENQ